MNLNEVSSTQRFDVVTVNENFETLDYSAVYGKKPSATEGLTWAYYGGRWGGFSVAEGTLTLTNAADNYVVVLRSTGAISVSTASTNWDNTQLYARVYKITVAGSLVTTLEDHRAGPGGVHGPSATTVSGPSSSTDNAIARWDSTTGKLLQNSVVTISDTGAIAGAISLAIAQGTITDPAFALSVTSTWNDAADTFVGVDIHVVSSASAAGSLIQRWRENGVQMAAITKTGGIQSISLGVGTAPTAANLVSVGGTHTGVTQRGINLDITYSGATTAANALRTVMTLADTGSDITYADVVGFNIGAVTKARAGDTVTKYTGFRAANVTVAALNIGFESTFNVSGSTRYAAYFSGTAPSYLNGPVGCGVLPSLTTNLICALSTTAVSSLRIPHGAAPTAPVDGDVWTTTAGLFVRINGGTVGPLA